MITCLLLLPYRPRLLLVLTQLVFLHLNSYLFHPFYVGDLYFFLEDISASGSFIPKINVKIIPPKNAKVSPTMYAHNVGPANAGIVVNPPKTNAFPTTLNIPIKAPPRAAHKQPATKGLLNLTINP